MKHTELRRKLRAFLAGSRCLSPASVFDAMSARVAESVGFEMCMMAGSTASKAVLGAPDLAILTLSEFADQTRRIMRVCQLPLLLDADNGYGNALNVMRCVEELEHAGASCLSVEDTVLPPPYGVRDGIKLTTVEEGVGKVRAALSAREDPELIIAARTSALSIEGLEGTLTRARAYAKAGADAIFLIGVTELKQLEAVHEAVRLPVILGQVQLRREELAARGARILLQGHHPMTAAVKALRDAYAHLRNGGSSADLAASVASANLDEVLDVVAYKQRQRDYLDR